MTDEVPDPFRLDRFTAAQDAGGTFAAALDELARGRKTTHWMWFVFPQLAGLGLSPTARFYAVGGRDEAEAYLGHAVLGPRLLQSADAVLAAPEPRTEVLLGSVDALKLRSSMTLFAAVAPQEPRFAAVLAERAGGPDAVTLRLLAGP